MTNKKIIAKAREADNLMDSIFESIERREALIEQLDLESESYIPNHLNKTVLLHAIRVERSLLLDIYKMLECDYR